MSTRNSKGRQLRNEDDSTIVKTQSDMQFVFLKIMLVTVSFHESPCILQLVLIRQIFNITNRSPIPPSFSYVVLNFFMPTT